VSGGALSGRGMWAGEFVKPWEWRAVGDESANFWHVHLAAKMAYLPT